MNIAKISESKIRIKPTEKKKEKTKKAIEEYSDVFKETSVQEDSFFKMNNENSKKPESGILNFMRNILTSIKGE